jgi:hypothetical protein
MMIRLYNAVLKGILLLPVIAVLAVSCLSGASDEDATHGKALPGTVNISGIAAVGGYLKANVENVEGTVRYQWIREGGTTVSSADKYTPVVDDYGKRITLKVSGEGFSGFLTDTSPTITFDTYDLDDLADYLAECGGTKTEPATIVVTGSINRDLGTIVRNENTSFFKLDLTGMTGAIPANMFENCSNLTGIILGNNITELEDEAFSNCSSLNEITMPGVITVGDDVFSECNELNALDMPRVTTLGHSIFSDGMLESITKLCFGTNSDIFTWDDTFPSGTFNYCDLYLGSLEYHEAAIDAGWTVKWKGREFNSIHHYSERFD